MEATEIGEYFDRLWPLLRSLTGDGVRETHGILSELVPLRSIEIPTGTQVFDWTVPSEWRVRDAYVIDPSGERILDVWKHNLHLLGYSAPFRGTITLAELEHHLHSDPSNPEAIPYRTSYYQERWGFCISHNERQRLRDGDYEVVIDTELFEGSMTLSEAVLEGSSEDEILISTYTCHPSMANNELSGPLVAAGLYRALSGMDGRRYTYRFYFGPETIGAIAYLSFRGEHLRQHLRAGFVLTCIGDDGPFTYKRSRQRSSLADRAATYVLSNDPLGEGSTALDFFPTGSDERQYCSPGFDLPVGSITRTMYGRYPEYHTSLDDRDFVSFEAISESIELCTKVCIALEMNQTYRSLCVHGEPQLGRRGLYDTLGASTDQSQRIEALMWLLNLADGDHDLLSVAERSGQSLDSLSSLADRCVEAGLLEIR